MKNQLTVRGIIIGIIGTVIITTASMFIALKLSSLPWPIMFVTLVSMFSLKMLGKTNLKEINVTQTAMSAGSMVAGGLAFTVPGIWMVNSNVEVSWIRLLLLTLGGVAMGLIFTALVRKHFIDTADLPYPMGQACAKTLETGDEGGKKAVVLFATMGIASLFAFLRDFFHKIPAVLVNKKMLAYGSHTGVYVSPMLAAVGYIIGHKNNTVWFIGAVLADFGILFACSEAGLWTSDTAMTVKQSLGIGLMVGTGIGVLFKNIIPKAKSIFGGMFSGRAEKCDVVSMRWAPMILVLIAFAFTKWLGLGVVASCLTIIGVWLATAMASECVGLTGINPMEIFGIIVLLAVKACTSIEGTEAFFVAAVVAVACGLCGDIMNDFKAGRILDTDPKAQWIGECIGSLVGAFVSVGVLMVIIKAYGGASFGTEMFPAAQAGAVSAMVGGISNVPAFTVGIVTAFVLYCFNVPVMTLGLGIYLPFFMSATAFIGGMIRLVTDKYVKGAKTGNGGLIVASGLLGGEGIAGVIIAIMIAFKSIT